jgi:hypothetical protein
MPNIFLTMMAIAYAMPAIAIIFAATPRQMPAAFDIFISFHLFFFCHYFIIISFQFHC